MGPGRARRGRPRWPHAGGAALLLHAPGSVPSSPGCRVSASRYLLQRSPPFPPQLSSPAAGFAELSTARGPTGGERWPPSWAGGCAAPQPGREGSPWPGSMGWLPPCQAGLGGCGERDWAGVPSGEEGKVAGVCGPEHESRERSPSAGSSQPWDGRRESWGRGREPWPHGGAKPAVRALSRGTGGSGAAGERGLRYGLGTPGGGTGTSHAPEGPASRGLDPHRGQGCSPTISTSKPQLCCAPSRACGSLPWLCLAQQPAASRSSGAQGRQHAVGPPRRAPLLSSPLSPVHTSAGSRAAPPSPPRSSRLAAGRRDNGGCRRDGGGCRPCSRSSPPPWQLPAFWQAGEALRGVTGRG